LRKGASYALSPSGITTTYRPQKFLAGRNLLSAHPTDVQYWQQERNGLQPVNKASTHVSAVSVVLRRRIGGIEEDAAMAEQRPDNSDTTSTAATHLDAVWSGLIDYFTSLNATEIAFNFGLTVAVIAALAAALWGFRRFLKKRADESGATVAQRKPYLRRLASWGLAAGRVLILLIAVYLVARIWGIDLLAWSSSEQGASLLKSSLRLALLFGAAIAANELTQHIVEHVVDRIGRQSTDHRRSLQLNTLGPLIRGLVQVVVLVIATLMILGELGVEIGPLIAGAGVVGLALGFGAQTLVKDFLTGVFLIIEDVVSVGDIVRIGDSGGLVEKMTLRTVQLRAFDGTLHVFPYSEAQVVHNMTKTFSYYVFDIQVAYESDVDLALDIMKRIGAEMQADEGFSDKIIAPIEVVGVDGFADSGVKLKARVKTHPIQQWTVGREFNRRLKLAFDAEGVSIPYPHIHVIQSQQEEDDRSSLPSRRDERSRMGERRTTQR